jgi:hypothetical protein
MRAIARQPTRRELAVNHGDKTLVTGNEQKTLVWISVEDSRAWTVYATARVEGPPAFLARVHPIVTIEWGHGGASIAGDYPIEKRLRVPVAASMVKLSAKLLDHTTGKAPPASVSCEITAFIAPGIDGETLRPSHWFAQTGASALVASGPQKVLTVDGYNAKSTKRWIMVFDATALPPNGTLPLMAAPATGYPGVFALRRPDSRGFLSGVFWAASSSPLTLTFDAAASLRVDAELLL